MPAILFFNRLSIRSNGIVKLYLATYIILSTALFIFKVKKVKGLLAENPEANVEEVVIPSMELIPTSVVYNPWVFLSATYTESNVFQYAAGLFILYYGVRYCEKSWNYNNNNNVNIEEKPSTLFGSETVVYLSITGILTNFTTVLNYIVIASFVQDKSVLLSRPIKHGILSILMSFIVVLKQFSPEHDLKFFKGKIQFRVKQLAFLILTLSALASIVFKSLTPFFPITNNFFIAWYYLRFIQSTNLNNEPILPTMTSSSNASGNANGGGSNPITTASERRIRGDASDTFAFIQFFPDFLKPYLRPVIDFLYKIFSTLGLVHNFNADEVETGNLRAIKRISVLGVGGGNSGNNSANSAAERRRQLALKVLEERVGGAKDIESER
ncbi:hypothetical protein PACTADRAFT_34223 [Pachysolen tannophilus NRRL Y-2460]|uniref:Uncharacterized protein n=1 Tax=Pachysolen tannophilus NRRL Y-2460 TaxID=669874 RepID=A0A1E4TVI6_PACTA|nr:hypothetical protein PACTADRAFT_34223 [Pachysolen tannophilus NRRL Y-2460]